MTDTYPQKLVTTMSHDQLVKYAYNLERSLKIAKNMIRQLGVEHRQACYDASQLSRRKTFWKSLAILYFISWALQTAFAIYLILNRGKL